MEVVSLFGESLVVQFQAFIKKPNKNLHVVYVLIFTEILTLRYGYCTFTMR